MIPWEDQSPKGVRHDWHRTGTRQEPSCLKQPGCTTHSSSTTCLFFHPPGSHAWTDLDVSVFAYTNLMICQAWSTPPNFQEFLKKLSAQLKKKYATGTCLCLEDDSYNSDPTSQFSRLNTYYLGLAQCYLSNSRHSVCSSTGPQKEGYYVIIISLKQPHA